jgi:CRISPR/Cas system Type II protein with McrA/HNH and RuvC-like nuclease domain
MERAPLKKSLRFNVFKRDSFTCQYCGATPPGAVLEVDHIHPVSQGGKDVIDNLITACFDCNRGKGAGLLTTLPDSLSDRAAIVAEKMEQLRAYEKLLKAKRKQEEKAIDQVEEVFLSHFPLHEFTQKFRQSVRTFLQDLDVFALIDYMHRACEKRSDRADDAVKYFCGICWNVIKGRGYGSR